MNRTVSLNGPWLFCNKKDLKWKTGTVPGCVQTDLTALGELKDYAYRLNEYEYHLLEKHEWTYKKNFEWSSPKEACGSVYLVFESIDTLADIYFNGRYLGRAENMFIPYRFDVSSFLQDGANEIEVHFDSPVKTIRTMEKNSPVCLKVCQETARAYVRKAQYSYGWDWGARIVQTGLWRPVYLEIVEKGKILYPNFYTEEIRHDQATVRAGAEVWLNGNPELKGFVRICRKGETIADAEVPLQKRGESTILEWQGTIDHPALWYPNGMGEQPLYEVVFTIESEQGIEDVCRLNAGIRTIRLIQEEDEAGKSFVFEVNGQKVFAKGANWIPADNLLPRLTGQDYRDYLKMAKEANMNMLRVWGGGIYELPAFYEICTEMGILVWQDFMYACAHYPDQFEWFRKLAEQEAVHAVKALRGHTCIALWCGNNENNWAFDEWWHDGDPEYAGNYIYKKILPGVLSLHDPSRPYWLSSPYGGERPNSPREGDRHVWDVWNGWAGYKNYLKDTGRFISEFGFHSLPSWKTLLSYTEPEDRHVFSPVMLSHERNMEGTEKVIKFIVEYLGFPRDFRSFVYLTQVNQALAVKCGVEHWRMRKFKTAGTLYWQLNDCWPGASWSCIDYYKRKKPLYYYTRKFYHNLLPVLQFKDGSLEAHVVNDNPFGMGACLKLTAYSLEGVKKGEYELKANLCANSAQMLAALRPEDVGIGYEGCIRPVQVFDNYYPREVNKELLDTVVYIEMDAEGEKLINYLLFDHFRNINLVEPEIQVSIRENAITLVSDKPAFGVWIETENDVDLSDNCLNLLPEMPCTVYASLLPGGVEVLDLTRMITKLDG